MRPSALKTLTWATVAAAVASALWLALVEAELDSTWRLTFAPGTSVNGLACPQDACGVGPPRGGVARLGRPGAG